MTLLHIVVEPAGGPSVAAEILTAATGETLHRLLTPGKPCTVALPTGIHAVRIAPPGADRITTTVVVSDEGPSEDTLTVFLPTGRRDFPMRETHTVGPLDPLGIRRLHRLPAAKCPEALDEARRLARPGIFVRSPFRTLLEPMTVEHALDVRHVLGTEHDEGVHLYVTEPDASGGRFLMTALPPGTTACVRPAPQPGDLPVVDVHPMDPDACALLDYQTAGRLDSAAAVTDHVADRVEARIAGGYGDPVAGCAVAHQLLSRPDRGRAHAWAQMLADEFPGSVDASVLFAWTLLSGPAATADPASARDRLITAADPDAQGLPVLLPGLRLLRTSLRRLVRMDATAGQWDDRVDTALRTVDTHLMAADPGRPFVSLTLTDTFWRDLADTADHSPAVPDSGTTAAALSELLTRMGPVTPDDIVRAESVAPPLTARWNGPDRRLTVSAGDDAWDDEWQRRSLGQEELRVAFRSRDDDRFVVALVSRWGTADLSVPDATAGSLHLLSVSEAATEPAVFLKAPTPAYSASTDERPHHVVFDRYELVLERTRQRAWHITARSHSSDSRPGWALLGVRPSRSTPYRTYALPLATGDEPGAESSLELKAPLLDSGWYAVPEPLPGLPTPGRGAILDRSLAAAADQWTRATIRAAAAACEEER